MLTVVAKEYDGGTDAVLLGDLVDTLVLEQRRASAAQGAICGNVDALFLAKVNDFLLWAQRVVLDLVDGGDNGSLGEQLLQVLNRVVGHTNRLDLLRVRLDQLLEVLPCVLVGDGAVDVAGAVFELGEERVVAYDC